MRGVKAVPQAGDGRHPGTAPGIGATAPSTGGQEQGRGLRQFLRPGFENIHAAPVRGDSQPGKANPPLDGVVMVEYGGFGNAVPQQPPQQDEALARQHQRPAFLMQLQQPQGDEIFSLCFGRYSAEILGPDILAPIDQPQNRNVPLTENHAYRTSLHIPACAENALAPVPAQELFRRFSKPPMWG